MTQWASITREDLERRIEQGVGRMSLAQRRLWSAIRVQPEKWAQHPYGDAGGGFWVVALIGRSVIWYNDIEDGFNRSRYSRFGTIDDYWCNRDELELALAYLLSAIERETDLVSLADAPKQARR